MYAYAGARTVKSYPHVDKWVVCVCGTSETPSSFPWARSQLSFAGRGGKGSWMLLPLAAASLFPPVEAAE